MKRRDCPSFFISTLFILLHFAPFQNLLGHIQYGKNAVPSNGRDRGQLALGVAAVGHDLVRNLLNIGQRHACGGQRVIASGYAASTVSR